MKMQFKKQNVLLKYWIKESLSTHVYNFTTIFPRLEIPYDQLAAGSVAVATIAVTIRTHASCRRNHFIKS